MAVKSCIVHYLALFDFILGWGEGREGGREGDRKRKGRESAPCTVAIPWSFQSMKLFVACFIADLLQSGATPFRQLETLSNCIFNELKGVRLSQGVASDSGTEVDQLTYIL